MRCRNSNRWIWPLCLGPVVFGCQATDEPGTKVEPAATVPADSPAEVAAKPIGDAAGAESGGKTPAATAVAQFSPPFPDRLELFEPPQRAQGTVRRDDQNGETVELKGFVNVDRPRAVLSIDGVISSIPEGGEKYGVQVISIQPPSVVLQRGRDRWPATLE